MEVLTANLNCGDRVVLVVRGHVEPDRVRDGVEDHGPTAGDRGIAGTGDGPGEGRRSSSDLREGDFLFGLQPEGLILPCGKPAMFQQYIHRRDPGGGALSRFAFGGQEVMGNVVGAARVIGARIADATQDMKAPA